MANTWCALHIWGQSRFYWVLININFIGTNIINIKDIPDVLCIWGQGRVCWGISKQRPPQKWSWLHGRFHPSPENMIIHLRYCCCLMLLLIYYSFVMYFLEFTIKWYLHLSCRLFQISLKLLLSAWGSFCSWTISLSFLISMMSNSMENCLHLIWVLSGSLTSTCSCLFSLLDFFPYLLLGSFVILVYTYFCFYLDIFVRVWPQEIAKEACVWHICWPHDSSEIIYYSLIDYRRLNLAAAIFFTNILWSVFFHPPT